MIPHLFCNASALLFEKYDAWSSKRIVARPEHITHLERRQKALEKEIATALSNTPSDDMMVIDLKRRMLHLRDELERLRHQTVRHGRPH